MVLIRLLNIAKFMDLKLGGEREGYAIVSKEDYEKVEPYKWQQDDKGYVRGKIKTRVGRRTVSIHRFIMDAKRRQVVDHINGNPLDNRRENLRVTNIQLNGENKHMKKVNTTSKYKGVYLNKEKNKFIANISHSGKRTQIGQFTTEVEAAEAYDMYVVHNKLDHICINFPEKRDDYLQKNFSIQKKREKRVNYYGVYPFKDRFRCCIRHKYKEIFLKASDDVIELARLFDKYVVENNIPYKKLNFPEEYPDYNPNSVIKTYYKDIDDKTIKLLISKDSTKIVKIDKEDYEKIKFNKCSVSLVGYVNVKVNGKSQGLHRYLMNETDPEIFIDHINNDPLDNRKVNLRKSDVQKNAQNKKKKENSSSKFVGISYKNSHKQYYGQIEKNGKMIYYKGHKIEEFSARKRDLFIMDNLKDDHYKLNFEWDKETIQKWRTILGLQSQ